MRVYNLKTTKLYPVGLKYIPIWSKQGKVWTILDRLITRNLANEVVKINYIAQCDYLGQKLTNNEVVAATIARAQIIKGD